MGMGNGVVLMRKPVCKDDIGINEINIDAELERLNVSLQVKVDGALVEWESNGYIPLLSGAEKAEIRLTCGKGIWGFNVAPYNPNKKATPEKPSVPKEVTGAKNYSKSDDRNIYHKTVHIENGAQTNYPDCIRLLRLDECNSNEVDLTEIGITFQRQRGYLTVQDVYEGVECYQAGNGNLLCPQFDEKWPSLVDFLRQIQAQGGFSELPHIIDYRPTTSSSSSKKIFRGTKEGFVKFFNLNAGFGVIQTISGDVYFDSESIISESKPLFLKKGAKVAFKNLIPSDKEGTFKKKAIGVSVIG